jgi:suppressor of fused protein SUFU
MSIERSKGGSRMLRHDTPAEADLVTGDEGLINAVGDHVTKHFGEFEVLHEIVSTYVHVDLYVVPPTDARPVYTVVTCGMSQRPMPGGLYAELMLVLPPTWPKHDDPEFEAEEAYWPFRLLKTLARLPHEYDTRLWGGDTVPNFDPPQPYAPDTKLCGALIGPMVIPDNDGAEVFDYDGREIRLFAVWPLYKEEMQVKLDDGLDRLLDLIDEARLLEIVKPNRPSVVPRRGLRKFMRRA